MTDLPTHPDFVKIEEDLLTHWDRDGVVKAYLSKNEKSKKKFSFLDGPITANNPMGVHHGRGRTYKDLWQRYHSMKGERERFQNGFDCQGLWVEVEVEKELGFKSKKDILAYGVEKFVNKCKERVLKYAAIQTEQSKRLGMFMDWPNSYFTMSDDNNYAIWNFLKVCHQRGWIYKGHDSVPWCPRCETAISQHEMLTEDYQLVTHKAIYLELPVVERVKTHEYLLVWTTTPWTIPANIAVAVDPKLEYALVKGMTGDLFWIAKEAVARVFATQHQGIIKTVMGKELVGLRYAGPFDDLPAVHKVAQEYTDTFHTVVATDPLIMPISTSEGTGLVHTAVSAGTEDFQLGEKLGLPMVPVIEDNADYVSDMGPLAGKNAKNHPEVIFDYLLDREKNLKENWIFDIADYSHRYPACWRCKTELVWKVTDEWYISMDKPSKGQRSKVKGQKGKTLREQMVEVTKTIRWIPDFGLERELDWLTNMHDWLISKKNRFWGLALPIYECMTCGWFDVVGSKEELGKRAQGGWEKFEGHTPHKPWIDEVTISCSACHNAVSRIEPVGNPWLDAGIVPFSTLPKDWFPADFITESFPGQFKNWFYAMLVMSTVLAKKRPFKTVLGFESVVGEDGRPMHKSWGNAIEFNEGASKIGVDLMRWMYAKASPTTVLQFGYKTADEMRRRFLLILWNSFRFFVSQAAADNWKPKGTTPLKLPSRSTLDRWIMTRLRETVLKVTGSLDEYQSAPATVEIERFVQDFSTWYIRRSRDRVGPTVPNTQDKQDAYTTMYEVLLVLSKLLAPFMPFFSDYLYTQLIGELSVHTSVWPKAGKCSKDDLSLIKQMGIARTLVEGLHSIRKTHAIPLRQPLGEWTFTGKENTLFTSHPQLLNLIQNEANVKMYVPFAQGGKHLLKRESVAQAEVQLQPFGSIHVHLDLEVTEELKREGWARQLVRTIQQLRKESGVTLIEKIVVFLSDWPSEHEEEIKRQTNADRIERSQSPKIQTISSKD